MKCQIRRLAAAAALMALLLSLCACGSTSADPLLPESLSAGEALPLPDRTAPESRELYPCLVEEGGAVTASEGIPAMTRKKYDVGSCRQLEGNPYVLVIFLDDDVSSWDQEGVNTYMNNLVLPALSFMEENAASWDTELNFQSGYYATYGHPDRPVKYDGVIKTFNEGETSKDILDQAAAALGFASKEKMHERMMEISGQDQVAYVIMLNKGGRSYSSCYSKSSPTSTLTPSPDNYYLEHSVIYTGFTDTSRDSASDTVAHEMLHLFGAEDYYYPDNREALAHQVYPEDIMLCAMPDLPYFNIGDFTAYTVGWTNYAPTICNDPAWW